MKLVQNLGQATKSKSVCVVGTRLNGRKFKALEVSIKGENVYCYCFRQDGERLAHGSYHKSGQRHTKVGPDYQLWSGGRTGKLEPMRILGPKPAQVKDRQRAWVIGWNVSELEKLLPPLDAEACLLVDLDAVPTSSIIGFEVSIVGAKATGRKALLGFPVLRRYRFSNDSIATEVEAFVVSEFAAPD